MTLTGYRYRVYSRSNHQERYTGNRKEALIIAKEWSILNKLDTCSVTDQKENVILGVYENGLLVSSE